MNRNDTSVLLTDGRERLRLCGIESYALDAEVLLMYVSGLSRVELLTGGYPLSKANPLSSREIPLDDCAVRKYNECLSLREDHMPVAYITNSVEFMSMELYIDCRALIPRPDTEILAESALEMISTRGYKTALDLCTGSGCIAIALAHYGGLQVTAVDLSPEALAVARINTSRYSLNIEFLEGDLFTPVASRAFDIVMANPPYIKTSDIPTLGKNVRDYEPLAALDGGTDGLEFYRRLCAEVGSVLNPGGSVLFEIGYDQSAAVTELFAAVGFITKIVKDLSGHDRVVIAEKREE